MVRKNSDTIQTGITMQQSSPDFNETWIFPTDFRENTRISNFTKIRPVAAELFHADRRTYGHDEADSRYS